MIKIERDPPVGTLGHDIDGAGHRENIANERGLGRHLDADQRRLLLLVGNFLLVQLAFGLARAAHKLVDHLLRQTWRRAIPVVRQQINVESFGGRDAVDFHFVRQRNPDCAAIGVAARNTYKSGSARVELLDSHCDRLLEGNDDNCARNADIGFDGLIKMKEQPHKAAIGDCLDLAFDRIVRARAKGPPEKN